MRRAKWMWLASLALVIGLQAWVARLAEAAPGVGALEIAAPLAFLAWLLFHPRPEGFFRWGCGAPGRDALRARLVPLAEARAEHKRLGREYVRARLGPVWLRCALASLVLAWWMASLGWVRVDMRPPAAQTPLGAWSRAFLLGFVLCALCSVFVSHLCHWESLKVSSRKPSRLEALAAFWMGLGWALASQMIAAVFSAAFWSVALLFAAYFTLGKDVLTSYELPGWLDHVTGPRRPRAELLLLAVPGMLLRALADWLALRDLAASRMSMLAVEIARERDPEADVSVSRRRVARGLGPKPRPTR